MMGQGGENGAGQRQGNRDDNSEEMRMAAREWGRHQGGDRDNNGKETTTTTTSAPRTTAVSSCSQGGNRCCYKMRE